MDREYSLIFRSFSFALLLSFVVSGRDLSTTAYFVQGRMKVWSLQYFVVSGVEASYWQYRIALPSHCVVVSWSLQNNSTQHE